MIADRWPLFGLVLHTPRLELRVPGLEELAELAAVAADGVHDPAVQPFLAEWTDAPPDRVAAGVLQWQWGTWAGWRTANWATPTTAFPGT
jgi:hypothetical protein